MPLSQRRERLIGRLSAAKTRAREGAVLVEGVRAVAEALDAGVEVDFLVTSPRLYGTPLGARFADRLDRLDVVSVDDRELDRLSDTERSQGVLLVCREPSPASTSITSEGRYLVLDRVQDPGNAGTLVRAAVAFGLAAVLCLDGTVDAWGAKAVRSSAGVIFRIPILRTAAADASTRLERARVPLLVADPSGEDVRTHPGRTSFALVVGNEGAGVRSDLAAGAYKLLSVRMPGPADSLNVAMAGAILLHELTRLDGHA